MNWQKIAAFLVWLLLAAGVAVSANRQARAVEPGLYLELGVGAALKSGHQGRDPQSVIRLRYESPDHRWWTPDAIEYNHHSSFADGRPFNHNPEDTTDQASLIWRLKIK